MWEMLLLSFITYNDNSDFVTLHEYMLMELLFYSFNLKFS
jgi:hypothetical protein